MSVAVPLAVALTGGEQSVKIGRPVTCTACQRPGAKTETKPRTCTKCSGSGKLVRSQRKGGVSLQQISTCPDCGGRGAFIDVPCPACGGSGQVAPDEALTVRIPIGVEERMVLRVPGHGLPAEKPGLPSGDLFIVVRTEDDPRFERHGRDLYRMQGVEVVDAVLGTSVDVPTLDGPFSVEVPAGSQPDTLLRLQDKGLPRFGGGDRGDLYIRLQLHVPEHLSDHQRQLFEQLRAGPAQKAHGRRRSSRTTKAQ